MFLIISSSPNTDGLTAACAQAAFEGIAGAGGQAEIIDISADKLAPCLICENGWGTCRSAAQCITNDVLGELQTKIRAYEGVVLVTPVYFGQPSERMKYFLDRFRRCEAFDQDGSAAAGKPVSLVAAAGGSGHGTVTCLAEMETWCRHVDAIVVDRIGATRFNRDTILDVIQNAGERLVKGEYTNRMPR